ncbi:MAG: hypothetical protein ACRD3F_05690 [Acidobacteriaceae bacterium]
MNPLFWIRRYLLAFVSAFVVIGGAQYLKGHTLRYAITQGLIWGTITAAIYVAAAIHRFRKGCACADLPQSPAPGDKGGQSR